MPAERPLRDGWEAGFHLIETMRWEKPAGLVRRDLHLARLAASAREFGFAFERQKIDAAIERALDGAPTTLRVRLALERDGRVAVTTVPFLPLLPGDRWRLGIAATRLDSSDPLLHHKTSRRGTYEKARAEFSPREADEVLLSNEKGELCEGTITTLFVETGDGPLATPPLGCGLLAGILRAEMLAQGKAVERVLTMDDLAGARVWVGNSLRGLIEAEMPPAPSSAREGDRPSHA
jgi:4-amino-4-deoxychorismate lyase